MNEQQQAVHCNAWWITCRSFQCQLRPHECLASPP
jgi:hypothetical protein